jgi:Calpain family cysteine protease
MPRKTTKDPTPKTNQQHPLPAHMHTQYKTFSSSNSIYLLPLLVTMALPTCRQLYDGNAGFCWNLICCPIFGTLGLLWRSFVVYCVPCATVLCQRCLVGCLWKYFCRCYSWPYEDATFFGASAIGDFDDKSAKQYEKETDWVRAEHLQAFKGKRPQLFEGEIEPDDLCQGAVGDCWLVAAFACASEFPHVIRHQFLTKEYNPRGLYKVRIYDPQLEKW